MPIIVRPTSPALAVIVAALTGIAVPSSPSSLAQTPAGDDRIHAALAFVRQNEARVLDDQARLCDIAAPPFAERQRAEAYRAAFERSSLINVRIDAAGNVLGERPGKKGRPHVVLSAHLDTVFPEGTSVKTSRSGPILKGPGIGDDCRGLAVVLGVARAIAAAGIETTGPVTFVGTVGEEGLGDLRGVKHLFNDELRGRVDRFVSVDGAGTSITNLAVGSRRYRVTFRGPGGHSYADFGIANPVHAAGRAIAAISQLETPAEPKTTFNVGRIGGGTSVNSIAAEAWLEIDLRSSDPAQLSALDARVNAALDRALTEENNRWDGRGRLRMNTELVGDRPAGRTDSSSPIVTAAIDASRAVGLQATLEEGSTDANIPISLGIPAVTIDGGGTGRGGHTLNEQFDSTDSWKGTARALLLTVALAR